MALVFNVKIKEIYIYPLGGILKLNMDLNIKPIKEFLILIMGPIFQFLAYYILIVLMPYNIKMIRIYHYGILGFNLLPIYPLDGGKLLKIILDNFISYKKSFKLIIMLSYIIVFIIWIINKKNINILSMVSFLLFLITKEKNKINFYYQKFILERYLNNYKFKKSKLISNQNNFYRNKKHIIKYNDKYYLEKEYLKKIYKKWKNNIDFTKVLCYNSITDC